MRIILCLLAVSAFGADFSKVAWIAGDWKGTMGQSTSEEEWSAPKGGAMVGTMRTVRNGKVVDSESLRIVERNNDLFYVLQSNGKPAVKFKLTSATADEAVFENAQNEFPKLIRYKKVGAELHLFQEAGKTKVGFRYQRSN